MEVGIMIAIFAAVIGTLAAIWGKDRELSPERKKLLWGLLALGGLVFVISASVYFVLGS